MRMLPLVVIMCFLSGILAGVGIVKPAEAFAGAVKVIVDTDMATDCDDAGALAIVHALVDNGECEILAVVTSNKGQYSIGACDAINTYYGRGDIPLGAYKGAAVGTDAISGYQRIALDKAAYGHDVVTDADVPDAVTVFRQVLAVQPDNSVVILAIGHMNNLSDLLKSGPDQYSPLDGKELAARKVKELSVMGGKYPSGLEHNFSARGSAPYTKDALENWPSNVHIMFSGYEIGEAISTGPALQGVPDNNPVKRAYKLMYNGIKGRPSWDLTTVLYGVRGLQDYWYAQSAGYNDIAADGSNAWRSAPDKNQSYLLPRMVNSDIAKILSDLMVQPPAHKNSAPGVR